MKTVNEVKALTEKLIGRTVHNTAKMDDSSVCMLEIVEDGKTAVIDEGDRPFPDLFKGEDAMASKYSVEYLYKLFNFLRKLDKNASVKLTMRSDEPLLVEASFEAEEKESVNPDVKRFNLRYALAPRVED